MSLFSWMGKKIGLRDGKVWASYFGGDSWAGESVTVQGAMQLSAFWAGVRRISETVATLPAALFEVVDDETNKQLRDHPIYELIHESPNADQTAVEFWEGQLVDICTVGNGFSEKVMSGSRIVSLQPMGASETIPFRDSNGAIQYRFNDRGKMEVLPEDKVLHIRGFGGGDLGLSPVAYARQTLGIAIATEKAAGKMFANGMRPSGWLVYKGGTLEDPQRKQIRENIIAPMTGAEASGKMGLLEADLDFKQFNITPHDAELIMNRRFNVEDVCRWLGIPPVLIGHSSDGQTMWGTGLEQLMIGWLTLGLRPYLTRIEQRVRKSLMTPAERKRLFVAFNFEALLRADTQARAEFISKMVQNGIYDRNYIRGKENLPPKPGGEILTVQSNLTPLDKLGKTPPRPVQPAPGEPALPAPNQPEPDPDADPDAGPEMEDAA